MRTFEPDRVALVDEIAGSRLIRGPFPLLVDGTFAYSGIADKIDVDLSNTTMTIVSLIDSTGEHPMLQAELASVGLPDLWGPDYWPPYLQPDYDAGSLHDCTILENGSPRKGAFMWWPIEGIGHGQDSTVFLTSPGWNLSGLIDRIISLMQDPSRTVYVHCSLGADRTGAVVTCYLMKTRGMPFPDAWRLAASQTPAGFPNYNYEILSSAYASLISVT